MSADRLPPDKEQFSGEELQNFSGEYSYLDYLIEKKFYRKYWVQLRLVLGLITRVGGLLTWFGVSKYTDLLNLFEAAEEANDRIQEVHADYVARDSLKAIKRENSEFYAIYLHDDVIPWREPVEKALTGAGFGFFPVKDEHALNRCIYGSGFRSKNKAYSLITKKKSDRSKSWTIAVVYNTIPQVIQQWLTAVFTKVYPSAEVVYFEDARMPEKGAFYYIYTGPYE